jgi:glycine/D-amino acid oxidase-like deaminating enzyme
MADIVVLGVGVCGLASAALLAEEGHDVVVLERDRTGRCSLGRRRGRAGRVMAWRSSRASSPASPFASISEAS